MARRSDHTRDELHDLALDAARKITEKDGLRGLKARQIVRDIGYTIGTLYNLFDDLDDLILQMNCETLDALYEVCSSAPLNKDPEQNLRALASRYLQFTRAHPNLWNAIFEYKLPGDREMPAWYSDRVVRLLLLEEKALAPLFPKGQETQCQHHAQVLWTSLFGMASVESANRLPEGESAESLVESLIEIYVTGLRQKAGVPAGIVREKF